MQHNPGTGTLTMLHKFIIEIHIDVYVSRCTFTHTCTHLTFDGELNHLVLVEVALPG